MPESILASYPLTPDGNRVLTPVLSDSRRQVYRITLQGCFHCAYNNQDYDALYVCDSNGSPDTTQPHAFLDWTPSAPILEHADIAAHRYVFRLPVTGTGESAGVRISVDRFVETFLMPPSEVRASLTGSITVTVSPLPIAPDSPWPGIGLAAVPAMLLAGGTGWVLRRRMALVGLDYDLQTQIGSIEQKVRAARSAVRRDDSRLVPVLSRLTAIQEGSHKLARQAQQLRRAQNAQDRPALERELKALHRQAERCGEPAGHVIQQTIIEKQKAAALLEEMREAETHCRLRLSKLEAVLASTLLSLQSLRMTSADMPAEERVCRALDAEVSALLEAGQQITFNQVGQGFID